MVTVMNLLPIWRDFVGAWRFNSPRMMLMRQIDTDFWEKAWALFEKSAEICFIRVIRGQFQPPMRRS